MKIILGLDVEKRLIYEKYSKNVKINEKEIRQNLKKLKNKRILTF